MKNNNQEQFIAAKQVIPGGVNSPVRSFYAVGGEPFFTDYAKDAYLYDIEGNQYIDFVCSWGANIVGHANPEVAHHIKAAVDKGLSYGTSTVAEIELALEIKKLVPSMEKVRLVSSGTEGTMSAIRLARGYSKKRYILKFIGCYHGHSDGLLVSAGSGCATFSVPNSHGVLAEFAQYTLLANYNDCEQLTAIFKEYGHDIAAIIIEPIAGNMNFIRPTNEFLVLTRRLCDDYNSVLIFDEVMTGFRVALGGAQSVFDITPDLTVLGKIVGGGMPLAAFGGRADIMDHLAPLGGVYQAGTLSGNPISVASGLANLKMIQAPGFYGNIVSIISDIKVIMLQAAKRQNIPFRFDSEGGMFGFFFNDEIPSNFQEMALLNSGFYNQFFAIALQHGIFFPPSMFEACFINTKHANIIDRFERVMDEVFMSLLSYR